MSTLADLEQNLLDSLATILANCGRPVDVTFRTWGPPPSEPCTEGGALAVWPTAGYEATSPGSRGPQYGCGGLPSAELTVRLYRCWPVPPGDAEVADPRGIYDGPGVAFADDVLAISLGFPRLASGGTFADQVSAGGRTISLRDWTSYTAQGGCAKVDFRFLAALRVSASDLCQVPDVPPVLLAAPVVSGGTVEGDELAVSDGSWDGATEIDYQWEHA